MALVFGSGARGPRRGCHPAQTLCVRVGVAVGAAVRGHERQVGVKRRLRFPDQDLGHRLGTAAAEVVGVDGQLGWPDLQLTPLRQPGQQVRLRLVARHFLTTVRLTTQSTPSSDERARFAGKLNNDYSQLQCCGMQPICAFLTLPNWSCEARSLILAKLCISEYMRVIAEEHILLYVIHDIILSLNQSQILQQYFLMMLH